MFKNNILIECIPFQLRVDKNQMRLSIWAIWVGFPYQTTFWGDYSAEIGRYKLPADQWTADSH